MSILELKCPKCKNQFISKNINIKTNKALCINCNTIQDIDTVELANIDRSYKNITHEIQGIREIKDDLGYTIEFDWKMFSNYKFHLTFGIIVTLFTLPLTIILIYNWQILVGLLTGLFSMVGLWLLNKGLQEYFNKTIIHFENDLMNIYHQPMTILLTEFECKSSEISQIFVKKIHAGSSNNIDHFNFNMWAIINDVEVELFSIFKEEAEAFYVERLIEDHLKIEDSTLISEHRSGKEVDPKKAQMLKFVDIMQKANHNKTR